MGISCIRQRRLPKFFYLRAGSAGLTLFLYGFRCSVFLRIDAVMKSSMPSRVRASCVTAEPIGKQIKEMKLVEPAQLFVKQYYRLRGSRIWCRHADAGTIEEKKERRDNLATLGGQRLA
jgi:hypothetical protein